MIEYNNRYVPDESQSHRWDMGLIETDTPLRAAVSQLNPGK